MKTKAEIVQQLLNEEKITVDDAVVLLMSDKSNKEYIFIPTHPFSPYNPYPYNPPYYVSSETSNDLTVNQN